MCDDQHECQLLPIWYCQLSFSPFLWLQSISPIIVIIFNFIWIIRRFWHVSYSSLQRRKECAFLWGICLFWVVFALKIIRVMIICYPTNKLMHVCIWKARLWEHKLQCSHQQLTSFTSTIHSKKWTIFLANEDYLLHFMESWMRRHRKVWEYIGPPLLVISKTDQTYWSTVIDIRKEGN